jgi:DNA polymerase
VTIGKARGVFLPQADSSELMITTHPSYLLRIEDSALAADEYRRFVADLQAARARLAV